MTKSSTVNAKVEFQRGQDIITVKQIMWGTGEGQSSDFLIPGPVIIILNQVISEVGLS